MQEFEKLGALYLGRPYDLKARGQKPGWLLYDSKDLVTHAVCVGMTGSGKTGLCLALLEEAAIDGIPAIAIDPKGDLANLLLTFPELRPADFEPWVSADEAKASGVSAKDFAAKEAERWRRGLEAWGQDGDRIRRFRDAADVSVYTPGSNAGLQVSVLSSFGAPPREVVEDGEAFSERIRVTASGVLGLLGVDSDPLKGREHILLASILGAAWKEDRDLDLASLIGLIQKPPVQRIGVIDLESFFPAKDRFALAIQLNNLLASPSFADWFQGEPLDVGAALFTKTGKPRISIYSIAHLADGERMFFVSLLLSQVLGWMRSQPGTTSLRAILYMDEIFGYFPPVANPPSKGPLLTLLKQARAFGLGVVLATQNPVDIDYKGLANAGTWLIGRLQTERDKARLLDGLEGAATQASEQFDRQGMDSAISSLGKRIFVLKNVHDDAPEVFETRWALSYLRGPLTRAQLKGLMDARRKAAPEEPAGKAEPRAPVTAGAAAAGAVSNPRAASASAAAPILPPDIVQLYLPVRSSSPPSARLVYHPAVFASARVYFRDVKSGVDAEAPASYLAALREGPVPLAWEDAERVDFTEADLEPAPAQGAAWASLPAEAGKAKSHAAWKSSFAELLYRTEKLELLSSPAARASSKPGESERDFRARLGQAAREDRDREVEALRRKYAPRLASLEERIRRSEQAVGREAQQASDSKLQTAISFGATLLGAFLGRKTLSASTLGRATTAARGVGRSLKEAQDVARAEENSAALRTQLSDLEAEFQAETKALESRLDPSTEKLERITVKPKKTDISPRMVALAWVPYWETPAGETTRACD